MVTAATSATSTAGLDVNSIVTQLMQVERQPLQVMARKQSTLQSRLSAYGTLKGAYSAIGDAAAKLANPAAFKAVTASTSDAAIVNASASTGATAGSYSIEVTQLAQAQKLASSAFAGPDSSIGTGTLNIQLGTFASGNFTPNGNQPAVAVTIGAGQNTLNGVRDAINAANAGVRASIVNDGSGYRLAISSGSTGSVNSLRITVNDDDTTHTDTSGLSQLAYDPAATAGAGKNLEQKAAAQDALLKIDGISVTKPANIVDDAISGVSLALAKLTAGTPVTVTIVPDPAQVKNALDTLVATYNGFQSSIRSLTGFNAQTRTGGLLSGDATARELMTTLKSALTSTIPGLTGGLSSLTQIGLSFQQNGSLALDTTVFNKQFTNPNANLAPLFAATGVTTDARVQFAGASDSTPAGSYAINITQAATRGALTGNAPANLTISRGVNDTLGLTANGVSASVTLAPGTYTALALAAEVQSRLNGSAAWRAASVTVAVNANGGTLTVQSDAYGSASSITASNGNAAADLFGTAPLTTTGADVAGTVGGSSATGSGRTLKTSAGLAVSINSTATGALGQVDFNRGYASRVSSLITAGLKTTGAFASRSEGLSRSVQDITRQQDRFNERLTRVESGLRRQYTALDSMLASMNTTSTYLTQQLAALQAQRAA